jgi:dihydrofolate reductase
MENPFTAIAAMSENRVIGRDNQIPWRLPADFKWFKEKTLGHVLIMGRKTFQSIGKPLPGRSTIVLSRSGFFHPGVRVLESLDQVDPADPEFAGRKLFICGGAQLYSQALPRCSELFLTLVKRVVDGDAFFPPFEDSFDLVSEIADTPDFKILQYRNKYPVP